MKLIIHGGFLSESDDSEIIQLKKKDALIEICTKGYQYLTSHTAVDTVVYTTCLLEDEPLFNAGTGSQIQSDGKIRMSASLMDGKNCKMSGVINVKNIKNPIFLAQKLLNEEDRFLSDNGAENYARIHGLHYYDPEIPQRRNEYIEKVISNRTSTVGCVCIDSHNNLAAATSTGGKGFEIPGRVSDSSTVAGNYANNYCAVSMTGVGEDIINAGMAVKIVTRVSDGMNIKEAFEKTFKELEMINGFAGAIAIDYQGTIHYKDSHPTMVFASFDGKDFTVFS